MHFDILILFFEILCHVWYIFGPYLLPRNHRDALIEEIEASFVASPFVDRGLEKFEYLKC